MKQLWLSVLALLIAISASAADSAGKPNVIIILANDYGWGSLGCYGGTGLKTPNLDRLAQEGRRFTHAYAPGSVCSPTRYGLMTGRYYWRTPSGSRVPGIWSRFSQWAVGCVDLEQGQTGRKVQPPRRVTLEPLLALAGSGLMVSVTPDPIAVVWPPHPPGRQIPL